MSESQPPCLSNLNQLPKRDIRLVFFDIDGTILHPDGHISEATRQQVARIQARGVKTAIASGRPHYGAQFLVDELNLSDTGLFLTGAHSYSPRDQKTLNSVNLERELVGRLIERSRELGLYLELYTQSGYFIDSTVAAACALEIARVHAEHLRCEPKQVDLARWLTEQGSDVAVVKLLVGWDRSNDQDLACDRVKQLAGEFESRAIFASAYLTHYPSWHFASVIHASACKSAAFERLLAHHGVSAQQVLAFGDAEADIEFIGLAGTGVAMANAVQGLKQVADYQTLSAAHDGVAYALERLIP